MQQQSVTMSSHDQIYVAYARVSIKWSIQLLAHTCATAEMYCRLEPVTVRESLTSLTHIEIPNVIALEKPLTTAWLDVLLGHTMSRGKPQTIVKQVDRS